MTKKRILFVGEDLELWEQLRLLSGEESFPWDLAFAKNGLQALASLAQSPCAAVVTDMQLPSMAGTALLDEVMQRSPRTLRFVRASLGDQQSAMRCVGMAHQYLVKPGDAQIVQHALERAFALEAWLPGEAAQKVLAQMKKLPSPPNLYFKIVAELQSSDSTMEHIGKLMEQDLVLSAKLLQMVNSAVFGLQLQVSSACEAVMYLGMETTKALVLLAHTFSYFDKLKAADFSVDKLWAHSLATGRVAEKIARAESNDASLIGEAFTAGMLHDIGKLLFAANLPAEFTKALTCAREQNVPLWEAESATLGVTHAELGASLLGIWGLPAPMVEAVALHHLPARLLSKTFCPLTAVHVANVLEHELRPDLQGLPAAGVDQNYLAELGLSERWEHWRDLCQEKML